MQSKAFVYLFLIASPPDVSVTAKIKTATWFKNNCKLFQSLEACMLFPSIYCHLSFFIIIQYRSKANIEKQHKTEQETLLCEIPLREKFFNVFTGIQTAMEK